MFLQTLRRSLQTPNNFKYMTIRLCNNTVIEPELAPRIANNGIHSVRITGTVANIFHLDNEQVIFYLNSKCIGNFKKVHKVVVTNRNAALLSLAKTKMALNQNISVEGKLSTSRIRTENKKNRMTSAIIATELCLFSDFAVANDIATEANDNAAIDKYRATIA